jgi:membrane-bound ClpP family serine protease
MAAEVKKPTVKKPLKAAEQKPRMQFAFTRKNYMILLTGIFLIIVGFILLAGGGTKDPNQFSYELFSTQRMVTAPLILLIGYITVAVAIMYKEKTPEQHPPVS